MFKTSCLLDYIMQINYVGNGNDDDDDVSNLCLTSI